MKKRTLSLLLAGAMMCTLFAGCSEKKDPTPPTNSGDKSPVQSASQSNPEPAGWTPSENINWIVTSSPGGGSDIYTRMISDIMTKQSFVSETFLVTNKTDGGGEIGRNEVANTRSGDQADHTLLTFNSGDLMPMVKNTPNRIENFTPIAIMAVDKQLMFVGEQAKYETFAEFIEAAKAGTPIVAGGSKGDDVATFNKLLEEVGLTSEQMAYITYDSTGDAITAMLGGHIDLLISKPAASMEYVEADKLTPVLALSTERYDGDLDAPTLSEIGDYEDVEIPVWRGVVGPANMSAEAAAFWTEAFRQVSETESWDTDYISKNMLLSQYQNQEEATAFITTYQQDYMTQNDIK